MSFTNNRKCFFKLAEEAGMVEDLAKFAKTFGRFTSASIKLADGRTASYFIPKSVKMKPLSTLQQPSSDFNDKAESSHTPPPVPTIKD